MWGGSWSLHAVSGVIHPWPSASACHSSHLRHLAFTQWVSHALIIAVRHRGLHTAVSVLWWAVLMIQAQWRSACSVVASPVSRAGGCFQGFSTLWCFGWMTLYQCNNVLNLCWHDIWSADLSLCKCEQSSALTVLLLSAEYLSHFFFIVTLDLFFCIDYNTKRAKRHKKMWSVCVGGVVIVVGSKLGAG